MAIRQVVIDDVSLEYLRIFMSDSGTTDDVQDEMWEIIDNLLWQIVEEKDE